MEQQRVYLAIDLKSFYASVECVDRGLDPLSTNLVVADASRTEKTICLAVSPSLKAYRIPGRARLFEVVQRTKEVNAQRLQAAIRQLADHIDGVESAGARREVVDQRGGALFMRYRHQHAGHVLPAAQGVEVGGHRVRDDIHRDHDAVHVLFSKVAVEVIR